MMIGHNSRRSSIDQVGRGLDNLNDAVKAVGERIASSGEEVGLCAIRQAEENSARFFGTVRALQDTLNSVDAVALFTWAVAEGAEARTEQLIEMGEVMSRNAWGPTVDGSLPKPKTHKA